MNRFGPRERWLLPLIGLVGLGGGIAIGVAASGGSETKTTTATVNRTVVKRTAGRTKTVRRVKTVVRTRTVQAGGSGGGGGGGGGGAGGGGGLVVVPNGGRTFSGRNGKNFGRFRVPSKATLSWSNKGDVFSILSSNAIIVSSIKKSGKATLQKGTYKDFRIAAIGRWTFTVNPH
jgi:hypothetical protein